MFSDPPKFLKDNYHLCVCDWIGVVSKWNAGLRNALNIFTNK